MSSDINLGIGLIFPVNCPQKLVLLTRLILQFFNNRKLNCFYLSATTCVFIYLIAEFGFPYLIVHFSHFLSTANCTVLFQYCFNFTSKLFSSSLNFQNEYSWLRCSQQKMRQQYQSCKFHIIAMLRKEEFSF